MEGSFTSENEVVAVEELDRKVFASAFRYSVEKLQTLYPAAKIYICTPIQGYITTRSYAQSKAKGDYLKLLADRMSLDVIDTFHCGICDIYEKKDANGRLPDRWPAPECGRRKEDRRVQCQRSDCQLSVTSSHSTACQRHGCVLYKTP